MPFLVISGPVLTGSVNLAVVSARNPTEARRIAETRFVSGPEFNRAFFTNAGDFTLAVDSDLSSSIGGSEVVYDEGDDASSWLTNLGSRGW